MTELNAFSLCEELEVLSEYAARSNHETALPFDLFENLENGSNFQMDNLFQDEDFMFLDPIEADRIISDALTDNTTNDSSLLQLSMASFISPGQNQASPPSTPPLNASSDWMLMPIPENLQHEPFINILDQIEFGNLETNVSDQIKTASIEHQHNVKVPVVENFQSSYIVRRQPLQMIQKVVNYPAKKTTVNVEKAKKRVNKRKQVFVFPREDGVMFISDGEEETEAPPAKRLSLHNEVEFVEKPAVQVQKPAVQVQVVVSPILPPVIAVSISVTPKSSHKRKICSDEGEKCPTCNKYFKRITLHRCKENSDSNPNKKIRMTFKCKVCSKIFQAKAALELHYNVSHGSLKCAHCKFIAKTKRGFQLHKLSCESSKNLLNVVKLDLPILAAVQKKKTRSATCKM